MYSLVFLPVFRVVGFPQSDAVYLCALPLLCPPLCPGPSRTSFSACPRICVHPAHVFVSPLSPGADSKDYSSAYRHFRNFNRTWKSTKVSTRLHQTPDKGIWALSAKYAITKIGLLYRQSPRPLLSGRIEVSQTCVPEGIAWTAQYLADPGRGGTYPKLLGPVGF